MAKKKKIKIVTLEDTVSGSKYILHFWCPKCMTMRSVEYPNDKGTRFYLHCGHKSKKWAKTEFLRIKNV